MEVCPLSLAGHVHRLYTSFQLQLIYFLVRHRETFFFLVRFLLEVSWYCDLIINNWFITKILDFDSLDVFTTCLFIFSS